jgi:hypothetical protein
MSAAADCRGAPFSKYHTGPPSAQRSLHTGADSPSSLSIALNCLPVSYVTILRAAVPKLSPKDMEENKDFRPSLFRHLVSLTDEYITRVEVGHVPLSLLRILYSPQPAKELAQPVQHVRYTLEIHLPRQ